MTGTWLSGWATGDIVTAAEFKKGVGSIFDSTLGGSAANIDITSIPATYGHLLVTIYARGDTAAVNTGVGMRFNGDTAANYDYQLLNARAAAPSAAEAFASTSIVAAQMPANTAGANLFGPAQIVIPHYAGSTNNKASVSNYCFKSGTATTNIEVGTVGGAWRSNAAINRITLVPVAGNFVTGTRCTIHMMGV